MKCHHFDFRHRSRCRQSSCFYAYNFLAQASRISASKNREFVYANFASTIPWVDREIALVASATSSLFDVAWKRGQMFVPDSSEHEPSSVYCQRFDQRRLKTSLKRKAALALSYGLLPGMREIECGRRRCHEEQQLLESGTVVLPACGTT